MKKLNELQFKSGSKPKAKRVARGNGSGCGGTAGRGHKGQKSRSGFSVGTGFEGGQMPLYRRMPKLKGFKNPFRRDYQVLNTGQLEVFETDSVVDKTVLLDKRLITGLLPVKLCAQGDLTKKLTIKVDKASQAAIDKVAQSGGLVEVSG